MHLGQFQVLSLDLCFDVLSPEHFMWSHSLQFVHCIDVADSFLVQTGQM